MQRSSSVAPLLAVFFLVLLAGLIFGFPFELLAQEAAGVPQPPAGSGQLGPEQLGPGQMFMKFLPMLLLVFIIFHFMVFKPQNEKVRQQHALFSSLKKGEGVVTSGGIFGKVAGIEEDHVLLEVAPNVRMKVERAQIARREKDAPKT